MAKTKDIKRLVRPQKGRKLAGVCIGIANYFNVDPTVIRIAWIFLLILGGIPGLFPYFLCWLIIPGE
jgi:phage shock protein PspC (stress-responsive transcriptional regulator)